MSLRCAAIAAAGGETITDEPVLAMNTDEAKGTEKFLQMETAKSRWEETACVGTPTVPNREQWSRIAR